MTAGAPALRFALDGRRAWSVWAAAIAVYVLAVFHRTSLGVAGLDAAERFGISSSQLSTFTILQVFVYAAMQLPVGALLDRFGSKRLLGVGLTLLTVSQLGFAFVDSFAAALACRVLLGIGDAMVFISVLRLVALWFSPRRTPMVTQVTGVLGQLGALAAAGPLAAALHTWGWTPSYATAAGVGILAGVALVLLVKDSPYADQHREELRLRALARTLRAAWLVPGTRLGLWSHFTSQFSSNMFSMLWGFPFLVSGQGLSPGTASVLLMVMVVTSIASSPVIGTLTVRFPFSRSTLVLCIVAAAVTAWTVVIAWPGRAPLWLLVVLVVLIAVGGPGSMVGFDLARTFNPPTRIGSASGIVNTGGFVATLAAVALVGVVLDRVSPAGPSSWDVDAFRLAMCVQYPVWALGVMQIVRYRRRARRAALESDPEKYAQMQAGNPVTFH
ncbi:MFS transporter [Terracoccus luteus]|uniref:Sugar phosphate permease n=1 Tax=Terracoccus luteus TaxID=53356 RepID=A0A839PPM5_9MICO|nr:MFS transporter [Terracoccus luteus]MBB2986248.1 sugar phosphate permease [Terracoccus luteus]MCP2172162.1 sugar phosphate permease [Terracoccus luteus]